MSFHELFQSDKDQNTRAEDFWSGNVGRPTNGALRRMYDYWRKTGLIPCIWRTAYLFLNDKELETMISFCPACHEDVMNELHLSMKDELEWENPIITCYLSVVTINNDKKFKPVLFHRNMGNSVWLSMGIKDPRDRDYIYSIEVEETVDGYRFLCKGRRPTRPIVLKKVPLDHIMDGKIKFFSPKGVKKFKMHLFTYKHMFFFFLPIHFHKRSEFPSVGTNGLHEIFTKTDSLTKIHNYLVCKKGWPLDFKAGTAGELNF